MNNEKISKLLDEAHLHLSIYETIVLQNLCFFEKVRIKDNSTPEYDKKEEIEAMQELCNKLFNAIPKDITEEHLKEFYKEKFPITMGVRAANEKP
jgi:hypothetical protein